MSWKAKQLGGRVGHLLGDDVFIPLSKKQVREECALWASAIPHSDAVAHQFERLDRCSNARWDIVLAASETESRPAFERDAEIVTQALREAVDGFLTTQYMVFLDSRMQLLEAKIHVLEAEHPTLDADAAAEEVAAYTEQIEVAFKNAFGETAVVSVRSGNSGDYAVDVELDATNADSSAIRHARNSGARTKFYEAIVDTLPPNLFDVTDFRFRFPK